jgi:hypothetical protein
MKKNIKNVTDVFSTFLMMYFWYFLLEKFFLRHRLICFIRMEYPGPRESAKGFVKSKIQPGFSRDTNESLPENELFDVQKC